MARPRALLLPPAPRGRGRRPPGGRRGRDLRLGLRPRRGPPRRDGLARLAGTAFTTSLVPRAGGYLLPLKKAVRTPHAIGPGDEVTVELTVRV
ncbi:DUF1905 domain-containing protein [Streptomyces sp. NPDC047046]|uniref:DUF1905 domain-containing protein n=1 Tax=Streptomyces sp. NPDC047046 TaxID=3155378 RepID=UPI0033FADB91